MTSITSKTRKMLWGRAGARCSFEGCRIKLIQLNEGESGDGILGEEAHIIAQNKDGARGKNPIEPQRINLYENLILLCPTHHTLVDVQPTKYTVQVLHQMKKAHESWVDHNLGGRNRAEEFHYIPDPVYERFCHNRLIHLWKYPKAHVFCCSYGSNSVEILSGIWKGSGIEFYRFPGAKLEKSPEHILNISEAEPEVEYRCDAEALEVTSYTYDPRVTGFAPFMTMRFEHDRPIEQRLLTLRLIPETAPIEPVLEYLRLPRGSANFEAIEENLFRLRNIGLSTPRQALEWTRELWGSWWCDGGVAESLADIGKQLEIVIEAEQVE
jgi:hypothetical protein